MISMMYGLTSDTCHHDWCLLDELLLFWYLLNLLEILCHCYVLGFWRFTAMHATKDPPYIKFAETKWRLHENIIEDEEEEESSDGLDLADMPFFEPTIVNRQSSYRSRFNVVTQPRATTKLEKDNLENFVP